MSAINRLFDPLRHAAAAFFKHDVALRRAEDGFHIVLQERGAPAARGRPPTRAEAAQAREKEELAVMRAQLAALLDEQEGSRYTMRHLAFVEHALNKKGLRAFRKLPLDVMERALEQLEGMVTNWSPVGLASLRSKMAVEIIDREHTQPAIETEAYRTEEVLDTSPGNLPEVEEVRSDDEALAAAYAALGNLAPSTVEMQAELGSPSARSMAAPVPRHGEAQPEIELRVLQA
jgi:hypothetical protein